MVRYLHKIHDLDRVDSILLFISYVLKISLAAAVLGSFFQKNYFALFVGILALVFTFIPSIISRSLKVSLPIEFDFINTAFVYASMFLGNLKGYYQTFWWWDVLLHTLSGVVLGMIGFLIIYLLYEDHKLSTSPFFVALFTITFAVSLGVLWEMTEFGIDQLFGTIMQRNATDTMTDLIVDSLGGILAGLIGFFYIKNENKLKTNGVVKYLILKIKKINN